MQPHLRELVCFFNLHSCLVSLLASLLGLLQDMVHCLGGVAVLLPLLEVPVSRNGSSSCGGSGGICAAGVLRLLAAMLAGSPTNQQAMQRIGGERQRAASAGLALRISAKPEPVLSCVV